MILLSTFFFSLFSLYFSMILIINTNIIIITLFMSIYITHIITFVILSFCECETDLTLLFSLTTIYIIIVTIIISSRNALPLFPSFPIMDQDFPLPVCPYAKIVPLNPSRAWATMGMPKETITITITVMISIII